MVKTGEIFTTSVKTAVQIHLKTGHPPPGLAIILANDTVASKSLYSQ